MTAKTVAAMAMPAIIDSIGYPGIGPPLIVDVPVSVT